MDSVTQTVLAGTKSVADAIGGAANARERRRARARQAWDRLAENTGKFASWVDEKAYETDAQSISDAVAAASIGGDYEKALQALANIPTKTAKGAADKLKAAMLLKNKQTEMDIEASRRVNDEAELRLRERGMDIEAQRNKWLEDDRAEKRRRLDASGKALMRARQPIQQTATFPVGLGMLPGGMSIPTKMTGTRQPNAAETMDRYVSNAGSDVDETVFNTLATMVAKETSAKEAERKNRELEDIRREAQELKEREFVQKQQQAARELGFKEAEFNWKKEVEGRRRYEFDQTYQQKIDFARQSHDVQMQRLLADIQQRGGDRLVRLTIAKMGEVGKDFRGAINQTFDEGKINSLREQSMAATSKLASDLEVELRAQDEKLFKTVQEGFPGATMEEAPVDPKSLSTSDLVKKINEKLSKAGK